MEKLKGIRAVFLDYTGTVMEENGKEIQEVIARICRNSDLRDPGQAVSVWWKLLKEGEEESYGEKYKTEDEIVDGILAALAAQYHLRENLEELHELVRGFWVHAPLFPDVKEFFSACTLPIYIISNNGRQYVDEAMREKGLHPEGIVCGDMVRAYKPHREIFDKALEVCGCEAGEVVHIGDSYGSDVEGAKKAGIRPILIQRKEQKTYEDVIVIRRLKEALDYIQ